MPRNQLPLVSTLSEEKEDDSIIVTGIKEKRDPKFATTNQRQKMYKQQGA